MRVPPAGHIFFLLLSSLFSSPRDNSMQQGHHGHGHQQQQQRKKRRRSARKHGEPTTSPASTSAWLLTPLSFLAFVLIHIAFILCTRTKPLWRRLRTWRHLLKYTEEDLCRLASSSANLPKHIAITLHPTPASHFDVLNRRAAIRTFVRLAGRIGVSDISIWDEDGIWEDEQPDDERYQDDGGDAAKGNVASTPTVHILTPATHGRQAFASLSSKLSPDAPLSHSKLDAMLRNPSSSLPCTLAPTEPDLLLILGGHWTSRLSLGSDYPRWDLRITELFHRSEDEYRPGRGKEVAVFAEALRQFQRAEQRYGK